jgi:hypothetical protein
MEMKYIVTLGDGGMEEIFPFSPLINHDAMAEAVSCIKNRTRDPWHRVHRQAISAGFVSPDGTCHGRSESLGLSARPEDTQLLAAFMGWRQLQTQ